MKGTLGFRVNNMTLNRSSRTGYVVALWVSAHSRPGTHGDDLALLLEASVIH